MRVLIIFAGASLALSACGKNDGATNAQNAADGLTAEKIVANDVTAIDAVTGDAANMAADMNYESLDQNLGDSLGNDTAPGKPRPTHKPALKTSPAPTANSAADTTATNSAD